MVTPEAYAIFADALDEALKDFVKILIKKAQGTKLRLHEKTERIFGVKSQQNLDIMYTIKFK